jgi:hypothetical protein
MMLGAESASLLRSPRLAPSLPATTSALSTALRFATVLRARLLSGDAYALGNALFVAGSLAYCCLDLLPPVGTLLDDALLVGLAALFVADAALYLRTWGGALVGRGPCIGGARCRVFVGADLEKGGAFAHAGLGGQRSKDGGAGGNYNDGGGDEDDGPTHLDLAAEWVNVAASIVYLAATVVGLLTPATSVAVEQLAVIYALQGTSSLLFFVDALLYALSWRAGLARAAAASACGGPAAVADRSSGGGGGGGASGGGFVLLGDPAALAHALNVLPALAYAACGLASLVLFALEAAAGRGADRFGDDRNVRGRLIAGAEPPAIEAICIVSDFSYLACSLCTTAAWFAEVEAESEGEGAGLREGGTI